MHLLRSINALAVCAIVLLLVSHTAGHMHSPSTTRAPLAMFDSADECTTCQSFVESAYVATQNATDMAQLLSALQADCAQNASSALLCDIIVGALVKELPKLPAKIYAGGYYTTAIVCAVLGQCSVPCCTDNTPTQVHLSVAGAGTASPNMMTVTWITADDTADRTVQYGTSPSSMTNTVTADSHGYTAGGWIGAIHTATMTDLVPSTQYFYRVGGATSGWSTTLSFTTIDATLPANFTFAVYGDLGAERNFSAGNQDWINYVAAADGKAGEFSVNSILHIGDISYADGYMERWDELFTTLQPAASSVPYMTVPLVTHSRAATRDCLLCSILISLLLACSLVQWKS